MDVRWGEPDHDDHAFLEVKRGERHQVVVVDPEEEKQQNAMLQNLGGMKVPAKEQVVEKRAALEVRGFGGGDGIQLPVKKMEFVHAFTGETKMRPEYLDYIDRNQPWDTAAEVSHNSLQSAL